MLKTVEIEIRGGMAEATVIPKGVRVIIKDYDYDGIFIFPEDLKFDENGDEYIMTSSPG